MNPDITPAEATPAIWIVYYEDADVRPEVFTTEEAARARLVQARVSWAAHLFHSDAAVAQAKEENARLREVLCAVARDTARQQLAEKEKEIERLRQTLEEHAKGNVEFIAVPSGILAERDTALLAQQQAEERLAAVEKKRVEVVDGARMYGIVTHELAAAFELTCLPMQTVRFASDKYQQLRADLDAAQADVKRMDWLENWLEKVKWDEYSDVRSAIDAAMKGAE